MILPLVLDVSRLRVGSAWSGDESLHYSSKAADIDQTDRFKLNFRVTGKENEMWVVYRKSTLVSTRIGDTEIPGAPKDEPSPSKQWLSPAGFLLNEEPFDKAAFPVERLLHFWLPASLPATWSADLTTTADQFVDHGRAEFTLVRDTPRSRLYALSYSSPENAKGITATGKLWFDVATGRLLEAHIDAKNVVPPGGADHVDLALSYIDSEVKTPDGQSSF